MTKVDPLYVCWTTVETRADAEKLAHTAVSGRLACCVQIDGPIESVYQWKSRIESSQEWRIALKTVESRLRDLEATIRRHHPYETPQWIACRMDHTGADYADWAREQCRE